MTYSFLKQTTAALAVMIGADEALAETSRTIASYPSGTFLENLSQGPDGSVLVTSYLDRTLLRWTGDGMPETFTTLDSHPVAVLFRADDIVLTVHGTSFTEGPAFTQTNAFVVLGPDGDLRTTIAAPDALFLNGMIEIAPDIVLAADSLAGQIWQLDLASGNVSTWIADPLLGTDPASTRQSPGANGLKRQGDWLYVSNSSRQAIYRLALQGANPVGALELFAQTGPIDDFAFLTDGSIVAASHGDALLAVSAEGEISTVLAQGCDGCTAVLPVGTDTDDELIVLTTGGMLDGGTEPARILAVPSPIMN